jgi:hypothetical protein
MAINLHRVACLLESSYNIRVNISCQGDEDMEQTAYLKWDTKRKIGKSKYVIWYWAIGFGLGIVVALTLFEWATEKRINASLVFIRILVFPIIGSLIGNVRWTKQEALHDQYQQRIKQ